MIDQIGIALTGVTAVFLSQSKSEHVRRFACLFGLTGQPFWFYSAWHAGQWGILALTGLYTLAWAKGFWQHWLKPKEQERELTDDELREGFRRYRDSENAGRAP